MSKKGIDDLKKEYEEIRMSASQVDSFKKSIERAKKENRSRKQIRIWRGAGTAVAAALIALVILPNTSPTIAHAMGQIPLLGNVVKVVTFRDYNYESENMIADIEVPQLVTADITAKEESAYEGEDSMNQPIAFTLEENADEINREIDELTQKVIIDFEENLRSEQGYVELIISHEVVHSTERYFTLKLIRYVGEASGVQSNYYYTIDLATGERLALQDLFVDGADYITTISEEIKSQMRAQMSEDENKHYWLDETNEEWNFKAITPDVQFYINENDNVVISFDEGEVAPMYMGVVTFEIPAEVLEGIRK